MVFGQALEALKEGKKVKRAIWSGYWYIDTYLQVVNPHDSTVNTTTMIMAKLKDNSGYAPAQPYQADLLAEDWEIVT